MSTDLSILDKKLPAHLQGIVGGADDEWASGTQTGFPVISTKSKVWSVKRGDETTVITREVDGEDEPVRSLQVVILRSNKGVSRTFYEHGYVEGDDNPPDCYSNDGIRPAADAPNRQCKTCAACPQAQWGSRITENGKNGKACSEVKRLAVTAAGQLNDPMLLRIPPTSLRNWDNYVAALMKRGVRPTQVITKITFDTSVSHQLLQFTPVGFVTEEMAPQIAATLQESIVEQIIGSTLPPETIATSADTDDEAGDEDADGCF